MMERKEVFTNLCLMFNIIVLGFVALVGDRVRGSFAANGVGAGMAWTLALLAGASLLASTVMLFVNLLSRPRPAPAEKPVLREREPEKRHEERYAWRAGEAQRHLPKEPLAKPRPAPSASVVPVALPPVRSLPPLSVPPLAAPLGDVAVEESGVVSVEELSRMSLADEEEEQPSEPSRGGAIDYSKDDNPYN